MQRVALGASRDGRLTAIVHEGYAQTSLYEENTESLLGATRMLYASPNCITKYRLVRGNIQTPLYMRAPGECSGVFALDSALDELAYKLKIDPLEMRIRNHADTRSVERSAVVQQVAARMLPAWRRSLWLVAPHVRAALDARRSLPRRHGNGDGNVSDVSHAGECAGAHFQRRNGGGPIVGQRHGTGNVDHDEDRRR